MTALPLLRDASAPSHVASLSGRVPVHDLDAESCVLSACMLEEQAYALVAPVLGSGEAYYSPANRRVWQAMVALSAEGEPIDAQTVASRLKAQGRLEEAGGIPYLAQIVDAVPSVANVESYARTVARLYRQRELVARCQRVAAEGYQPTEDPDGWIAQSVAYVGEVDRAPGRAITSFGDVARGIYDELERPAEGPGAWLSTGLPTLDRILGGLLPGDVVVVGARAGMGKSSLVRHIALSVAAAGRRAALFSREMPKKQIGTFFLTALTGIDGRRWRSPGDVRKHEMTGAVQWAVDHPIEIYDHLTTPGEVVTECKALRASPRGLDVAIVDYLQTFRPGRGSRAGTREQVVSEMMADFAGIATPPGPEVPVIVISALRKHEGSGVPDAPTENELRESGAIGSWATTIVLLHRPDYYRTELDDKSGPCQVIVPKNRSGKTGATEIYFHAPTATFREMGGL